MTTTTTTIYQRIGAPDAESVQQTLHELAPETDRPRPAASASG